MDPSARPRAGGLSASTLKLIAIAAMLVDHATYVFMPGNYFAMPALALHMVGRITAPIMFFFVVEGYHHTRNKNRYTLRMAAFAAISYLPFIWALRGAMPWQGHWLDFDVIYTLLMGLLALRALHEVKHTVLRWLFIGLCLVAASFGDWGFWAVLYILVFDLFRPDFKRQALGFSLVTLAQLLPPLAQLVGGLARGAPFALLGDTLGVVLYYAAFFIPLGLLAFYNGRRGGAPRWLFYVFYPAHLVVIALVRDYLLPALR